MCPIFDGYGFMGIFNSRTRPRVNRVTEPAGGWCTQLAGSSFALKALFLPPNRSVEHSNQLIELSSTPQSRDDSNAYGHKT